MRLVKIRYGVGYGTHHDEIEVEDDATYEEIESMVQEVVTEKLDWGFSIEDPE